MAKKSRTPAWKSNSSLKSQNEFEGYTPVQWLLPSQSRKKAPNYIGQQQSSRLRFRYKIYVRTYVRTLATAAQVP